MHLFLAALLLIAGAAPAPPPLDVVFVEVRGAEPWTPERERAALDDARAALDWLAARGLAAPGDVQVAGWLPGETPPALTLYVVNNAGRPDLWLGDPGTAGTVVWPTRAYVLAEVPVVSRQAAMAHELAHLITGLPDWPACDAPDILCSPGPAYAAGTLGCRTLDALGTPCQRTYLPGVSL